MTNEFIQTDDAEKAHLLAVALELLEALEECLPHVEASGFDPNGEVSILVRAAIAKARGTNCISGLSMQRE